MATEFELLTEKYIHEDFSISEFSALHMVADRHKYLLGGLENELEVNLSVCNYKARIEYLERVLNKFGRIFPLGQIDSTTRFNLRYFGHNKEKITSLQDAEDYELILTLLDISRDKSDLEVIKNTLDNYHSQAHVFRKWKLPVLFDEKNEIAELIIELKKSKRIDAFRFSLDNIERLNGDIDYNIKGYLNRFLIVEYKFSKAHFVFSVASILILFIDKIKEYEVRLIDVFKQDDDLKEILHRLRSKGIFDANDNWHGIQIAPLGLITHISTILALAECLKQKKYLNTAKHKVATRAFFNHLKIKYHEATLSKKPKDFEKYLEYFNTVIPDRADLFT